MTDIQTDYIVHTSTQTDKLTDKQTGRHIDTDAHTYKLRMKRDSGEINKQTIKQTVNKRNNRKQTDYPPDMKKKKKKKSDTHTQAKRCVYGHTKMCPYSHER